MYIKKERYGPADWTGCVLCVVLLPLALVAVAVKKVTAWVRSLTLIIPPLP